MTVIIFAVVMIAPARRSYNSKLPKSPEFVANRTMGLVPRTRHQRQARRLKDGEPARPACRSNHRGPQGLLTPAAGTLGTCSWNAGGSSLYYGLHPATRNKYNDMKSPVVVIGIGEMGSVFARGLLRLGHPVYPVTRATDMYALARQLPAPEMVLVAVAENTLHSVLEILPPAWHHRVALLQNELLPQDWERYGFTRPTVISVWFEKKPGQDVKILIPSPVFGPQAGLLVESLALLNIPARHIDSAQELLFELVLKNVYIVTINCAGLVTGGTVTELWSDHHAFAEQIAREVIAIQQAQTGKQFDADALIRAMLVAFAGDPQHVCTGRSAPVRLARALQQADAAGLAVPGLREIANTSS
jgi:ketopantoate reductase